MHQDKKPVQPPKAEPRQEQNAPAGTEKDQSRQQQQ